MLIKAYGSSVHGIEATTITVEVNISPGARFFIVGLADNAIKESQQRIESALKNNGFHWPGTKVIVNLAPADIRKEGTAFDLPLAVGLLAASGQVLTDKFSDYVMTGELSLDGGLQRIRGVLPMALKARKDKFKGLILPMENAREAAVVDNLEIIGVESLVEAVGFLNGSLDIKPVKIDTRKEFFERVNIFDNDFSEVKGQENVKRALEIAVAGGHNIIMI
jgi:magnesium chelatase family protein